MFPTKEKYTTWIHKTFLRILAGATEIVPCARDLRRQMGQLEGEYGARGEGREEEDIELEGGDRKQKVNDLAGTAGVSGSVERLFKDWRMTLMSLSCRKLDWQRRMEG